MKLFQFVFLVSNLIIWKTVCNGNECKTPQFIEIGAVGVIRCSFRDDISGALWYKLTTHLHGNAFLTLANSEKSGEGYLSGEFDIFPNGSLIIQNVSIKHEGTYKVTILETTASDPKTYFVNVSVFAPTFSRVPVIDNCDNKSEICFQILNSNSHLSCTIRDARPAIPLRLMIRTGEGDLNISSRLFIENETYPFFTSRVTTTNALVYTRALTLLACEAYCPLGFLEKNESLVLIQGSDDTLPNVLPKVVYAKQDTRVKLNCSGMTISYLVWQVKKPSEVIFKGLLHAVFVGHNLHHRYDEEYEFQNTSIVIDNVRVHHEGTYRCISGNGFQDDLIMYELIVFGFILIHHTQSLMDAIINSTVFLRDIRRVL
ncbi:hypothetical protein HOLleu_43495 [Holothuria leucospilota]|uniref:Immunoglobulin domain-containing protein n=1 Tax=Holothuria leucospilota TaxID=206669 RepID=A0A9Q0Y9I8_HOLLE|nr:hypothetical protein HOLleu_43495 [Holothuria leucospilota]